MRTSIRNILSAIIIMSVLLCNAMAIEKENIKINSAAEELIVDFLDAYSTSLVELTPLDYSDFFWDTESTTVFALLTDYRIEYDSLWDSRYSNISIDPEFSNISAVDDEIVADVKLSYEANIWHDGKSEKTLGVIDFTFTLKASDDNWKISAITREGDEEWIEDATVGNKSNIRQYFGLSIYDISAQDTTDLSDTCAQIALPAILIRLLDAVIRRGELSKNEHSQLCQLRSTLCERFVLSFKALDESDPLQTKYCLFFSLALSMLARDYRTGVAGTRDLIKCAGYAQQCINGEKKLNIPKADG